MPRGAVLGLGGGLLLMGLFTAFWADLVLAGIAWGVAVPLVAVLGAGAVVFVVVGIRTIVRARRHPRSTPDDPDRRIARRYAVVFATEGVAIGVVCAVLGIGGVTSAIPGAIALVVGLHFLPFAWVFSRRIDLLVGGGVIAGAVVSLVLLATHAVPTTTTWSIAGATTAIGTFTYGILQLCEARRVVFRPPAG